MYYPVEQHNWRGKGVPRVHIMENELERLGYRKGHGGHLAKKFLNKYYS